MITFLHAVQVPLAAICGAACGTLARRRRFSGVDAYALALIPGVLLAVATAVFGPSPAARNEQFWQGLVVWAAWSLFGTLLGVRGRRQAPSITTLGLGGNRSQG